jgi:hypothetical protein
MTFMPSYHYFRGAYLKLFHQHEPPAAAHTQLKPLNWPFAISLSLRVVLLLLM